LPVFLAQEFLEDLGSLPDGELMPAGQARAEILTPQKNKGQKNCGAPAVKPVKVDNLTPRTQEREDNKSELQNLGKTTNHPRKGRNQHTPNQAHGPKVEQPPASPRAAGKRVDSVNESANAVESAGKPVQASASAGLTRVAKPSKQTKKVRSQPSQHQKLVSHPVSNQQTAAIENEQGESAATGKQVIAVEDETIAKTVADNVNSADAAITVPDQKTTADNTDQTGVKSAGGESSHSQQVETLHAKQTDETQNQMEHVNSAYRKEGGPATAAQPTSEAKVKKIAQLGNHAKFKDDFVIKYGKAYLGFIERDHIHLLRKVSCL